ncbi:MAG: hypothetical protein O9342_01005 [Beijerinckiaceae bacterium]|nr:hypothetical protein [Beijerinckiaceae bacterium]
MDHRVSVAVDERAGDGGGQSIAGHGAFPLPIPLPAQDFIVRQETAIRPSLQTVIFHFDMKNIQVFLMCVGKFPQLFNRWGLPV